MSVMQQPIVGAVYVNPTGKTFRIRMLGYAGKRPANVLLEYAEGSTHLVSIEDWHRLDLDVQSSPGQPHGAWISGGPVH